ncbi:MAG: uroporphyrinogen-III C-methyltransferase [Spirulinaceae cyanobacterium SM2_1_0]|nr:uroporphyrinogen-III C-methyltransferase [Spirulinaceae cyanobacterium SM2_1_0]
MTGKVYLVGVGSGRLAHLTLGAQQCLQQAEVAVCDLRLDPEVLQLLPANCQLLAAGKQGGEASTPQADINRWLVEHCQAGRRVVRLKGGDPLVFGRARAEVEALQAAGCDFEIVPGLSSALLAPLLVGIPVTDKDLSRCLAIATAHALDALDWAALARLDTLIFLMGGRQLAAIATHLQANGREASTPIAIIRAAGSAEQQLWIGTLADIAERVAGQRLAPCIIVIGAVVALRDCFQPAPVTPSRPLSGKTILVTRAAEQASDFCDLLMAAGATVLEMPALVIQPPSSWQPLDAAIAQLEQFDWLILTSSNAIAAFCDRLFAQQRDLRALAGLRLAVVGRKTARYLADYYLQADFIPPDYIADALIEHFPAPLAGQRCLFPRVESGGRDVLIRELTARGAQVTAVPAYQSGQPATIPPLVTQYLQQDAIDVVTFASSKTVLHFCNLASAALQILPAALPERLATAKFAAIGPQTAQACHQLLQRLDIEAREYTLEGLTAALIEYFQS